MGSHCNDPLVISNSFRVLKVKESLEEVEITIHNPSKVKKRYMAMGEVGRVGMVWRVVAMGIQRYRYMNHTEEVHFMYIYIYRI